MSINIIMLPFTDLLNAAFGSGRKNVTKEKKLEAINGIPKKAKEALLKYAAFAVKHEELVLVLDVIFRTRDKKEVEETKGEFYVENENRERVIAELVIELAKTELNAPIKVECNVRKEADMLPFKDPAFRMVPSLQIYEEWGFKFSEEAIITNTNWITNLRK